MTVGPVDHRLKVPATIIPRTQTGDLDRYNTAAWVDGEPVETLCWYYPATTEEQVQRPAGIVTFVGFFPLETPITTTARVLVDGLTLEVAAPPEPWKNPDTRRGFLRVEMLQGPDLEVGS